MNAPPVVVVESHTTRVQRAAIEAACRLAGLSFGAWRGRAPEPAPKVVVAGLPAGGRVIPADVIAICDALGDDVPLLLLAAEPLVRSWVTLQAGRVLVSAEPHDASRLCRRLRLLVDEGGRENLRAVYWASDLARSGPRPRFEEETMTAVVAASSAEGAAVGTSADSAREAVERLVDSPDLGPELARVLADRAGLVHLTPGARDWVVYWPLTGGLLRVFSASRLPSLYDLGAAARAMLPRPLRLPARGGDVLLALSENLPASEEQLSSMMGEGGPRMLRQRAVAGVAATASGLIAEVC